MEGKWMKLGATTEIIDMSSLPEEVNHGESYRELRKELQNPLQHRVINDKQYVTLGSLNAKSHKRGSLFLENYHRLEDSSGGPLDTEEAERRLPPPGTILADLEYTSAPLNVDGILQSSSPAR